MRVRMNGGVIGPTNPTSSSVASGVFSVVEAQLDRQVTNWPIYSPPTTGEQYFRNTRLLVHGDGSLNANNNTIIDSSSQSTTLTRTGTTTQGSFSPYSQTGWSNYFTAAEIVICPASASNTVGTGNCTIEAWIYLTATGVAQGIAASHQTGGMTMLELDSTNHIYWRVNNSAGVSTSYVAVTSATTIALNTWTHVAVVRNGTELSIWINGNKDSNVGSLSPGDNMGSYGGPKPFYVGASGDGGNKFSGYISNFRFINGTAVYTSNFTPSTTPLTAITNTRILTCQSNRFVDNGPNGTITLTGSPRVVPISPFAPTISYGVSSVGGSISAITAADAITGTMAGSPGTGDFSIEFWLYPTSYASTTNVVPFALGASNAAGSLSIFFSSVTPVMTFRYGTGGSGNDYNIGSVPTLNTWTHYVFCRNGGTTAVYVNGVLIANTTTAISGTPSVTATSLAMFALAGLNQYLGYVSGVRYVSGSSAYTAAFTPPTGPVPSYGQTLLLLNATNGSIYDSSTKNNIVTNLGGFLSTTQSKFGGSSIRYPGGLWQYTTVGPQNSLGSGDFTIEFWIWFDAMGSQRPLSQGTYTTGEFLLIFNANGSFDWGEAVTSRVNSGASAVTTGAWYHIAIVRSGLTTSAYVNGSLVGTPYTPATNYNFNATTAIFIGGNPTTPSQTFTGYIDELRITVGVARYTGNFTPSTSAFLSQ